MPIARAPAVKLAARMAALAVGAVLLVPATNRASAGEDGRKIVAQSRFGVSDAAAQARLVQLVVDFAPGAWTSLHTHGGQAINLVLEGEITLRQNGIERPHRAGESWSDSTSQIHAAGNTSSGTARLLTNFLLPKDAPEITVFEESRFGPTIAYGARLDLQPLPAETDIVQQVLELPPGWHAERSYGGIVTILVIEGEVTYQLNGEPKQYRAGEALSLPAHTPFIELNSTNRGARVFTSYLLPRAAQQP